MYKGFLLKSLFRITRKCDTGNLSDFEDIFEPKRQKDDKENQDVQLHNLAEFLYGFDDDELENEIYSSDIACVWKLYGTVHI